MNSSAHIRELNLLTLQQTHQSFCEAAQTLNMTRGLPAVEQIALAASFMSLPGNEPFQSADGIDWLNYGGLQGIKEVRDLFGPLLLALPGEQVVIGENSSLALMHEAIGHAWIKGFAQGIPWGKADKVKFICPEPGYDRHFAICEYYGIEMVRVRSTADGPDIIEVERLVKTDPSIKGMWCVPKHANPNGASYSPDMIRRLAAMPAASPDFKIFWDNAYAVHDFADEVKPAVNVYGICSEEQNPDRFLMFASTSKMLIPSAGIALFGGSPNVVAWWLGCMKYKTIGPDKVNQVRHLMFFKNAATAKAHMRSHAKLLREKFQHVETLFRRDLSDLEGVTWSTPTGGYFISLEVPPGLANRVVELAEQAKVKMTPAGATHCYGVDAQESYLRIAPSYLSVSEVQQAAQVIACAVLLACAERSAGPIVIAQRAAP